MVAKNVLPVCACKLDGQTKVTKPCPKIPRHKLSCPDCPYYALARSPNVTSAYIRAVRVRKLLCSFDA